MSRVPCHTAGNIMGYLIELEPLTGPFLECGDTSPLWNSMTCHRVPKRGHARALQKSQGRAWRVILPTALERDTLLMPDVIAEAVTAEAERFLQADLPADWAVRLATRAEHLYGCNRHFRRVLNGRGNQGRNSLYMYMRHWTAGWLKCEQSPLFGRMTEEFALGVPVEDRSCGPA